MITAVGGSSGVGKTTWIREQIAQGQKRVLYFCPSADTMPIDGTWIADEFGDRVEIITLEEESRLRTMGPDTIAYIELGFHLDLQATAPVLDRYQCDRVAIVPEGSSGSPWHEWGNPVIAVPRPSSTTAPSEIFRGVLTGEMLDPASLEIFWYELTEGAYGTVTRAKGIFELVDGQSILGDFTRDGVKKDFQPLNRSPWLEGRPDRFSGLEVVGETLDKSAISLTLQEFCLGDNAIAYYQQQLKDNLENSEVALS